MVSVVEPWHAKSSFGYLPAGRQALRMTCYSLQLLQPVLRAQEVRVNRQGLREGGAGFLFLARFDVRPAQQIKGARTLGQALRGQLREHNSLLLPLQRECRRNGSFEGFDRGSRFLHERFVLAEGGCGIALLQCFGCNEAAKLALRREAVLQCVFQERNGVVVLIECGVCAGEEVLDLGFLGVQVVRALEGGEGLLRPLRRELAVALHDPRVAVVLLLACDLCEQRQGEFALLYLRECAREEGDEVQVGALGEEREFLVRAEEGACIGPEHGFPADSDETELLLGAAVVALDHREQCEAVVFLRGICSLLPPLELRHGEFAQRGQPSVERNGPLIRFCGLHPLAAHGEQIPFAQVQQRLVTRICRAQRHGGAAGTGQQFLRRIRLRRLALDGAGRRDESPPEECNERACTEEREDDGHEDTRGYFHRCERYR